MLCGGGLVRARPVLAGASGRHHSGGAMGTDAVAGPSLAYERDLVVTVPIVSIWHCGGARPAEGVVSLHAAG